MRDYREFKPVSHTLREAIMKKAVAYYRTSSMSNVGEDKDSLKRQQRAVEKYAKQKKKNGNNVKKKYAQAVGSELLSEFHNTKRGGKKGKSKKQK